MLQAKKTNSNPTSKMTLIQGVKEISRRLLTLCSNRIVHHPHFNRS